MPRTFYKGTVTKLSFVTLGFLLVIASAISSNAKSAERGSQMTIGIVTNKHQALGHRHSTELKAHRHGIVAGRTGLKPAHDRAPSRSCGCSLLPDTSSTGFGTCLKSCMADAGVSAYSLAMCGAACAAAWTGVGAIACAICVGLSVTVVEWCALGCATYGGKDIGRIMEARNIKHRKAGARLSTGIGLRQAKA